jgi:hypothetical protein
MKLFKVELGLGRMANHHPKSYEIKALTDQAAARMASGLYRIDLERELGDDPILGKIVTVVDVNEIEGN